MARALLLPGDVAPMVVVGSCVDPVGLVEVRGSFVEVLGEYVVGHFTGAGVRGGGWMAGTAGRLNWRLSETTTGSEPFSLEEAMWGHRRTLGLKDLPNTKRSGSTPTTQ